MRGSIWILLGNYISDLVGEIEALTQTPPFEECIKTKQRSEYSSAFDVRDATTEKQIVPFKTWFVLIGHLCKPSIAQAEHNLDTQEGSQV